MTAIESGFIWARLNISKSKRGVLRSRRENVAFPPPCRDVRPCRPRCATRQRSAASSPRHFGRAVIDRTYGGGLNRFGCSEPHHDAGPEQAADLEPGVIGRYCGKRKIMRIDRHFPLRLDDGKQNTGGRRFHLLNGDPFMLCQPIKERDGQVQFTSQMRTKKRQYRFNVFWIADVHSQSFYIVCAAFLCPLVGLPPGVRIYVTVC